MGIKGLLPLAAPAIRPVSASELKDCTVAADAYCWLHRGVQPHQPAAHIKFCMKYVYMLLSFNIKPILVFDGRHLPAKAITEEKRRESRSLAKKRAAEFTKMGKLEEARKELRKCIDITHEMALELIRECRKINVDCIVAPYEADAQLAYLNREKIADFVITEDSDLLLFGCNKVIFKMDTEGNGMLYESTKLPLVMKCPLEKFSFDKFRHMCILSGCDYLASLRGIGLAKARQFINATQDPDVSNALRKLPSYFKISGLQVTDEYREKFLIAEATFKHQLVYNPLTRKMVPLNDLDNEGTDLRYCCNAGTLLDPDVAFQIAIGNLDPFTLKRLDDWHPDNHNPSGAKTNNWNHRSIAPHPSIWSKNYKTADRYVKKEKQVNAISIPTTKHLVSKVVHSVTQSDEGLSMEDLSAMYCTQVTAPIPNIIVPETQDLDDLLDWNESPDLSQQTSPIIKKSNVTYKRLSENGSFDKAMKISKFERTVMEDDVVQSQFFETYTPESIHDSQKENDLTAVKQIEAMDVDSSMSDDKIENSVIEKSTSPRNPFKMQQVVESVEKFNKDYVKYLEVPLPSQEKPKLQSVSSIKRVGSCRTPGLKRTKSVSKQQSLLTTFGFEKKSQLRH